MKRKFKRMLRLYAWATHLLSQDDAVKARKVQSRITSLQRRDLALYYAI